MQRNTGPALSTTREPSSPSLGGDVVWRSRRGRGSEVSGSERSKGFSLVELMVVVAIVAILAGIAVPSMMSMLALNRLSSQANDLIGAVQYARSEAIKRNRSVSLCRTSSATTTVCAGEDEWANWIVVTADGEVLRRGAVSGSGSTLRVSSSLGGGSLTFVGNGLSNAAEGGNTLTICTPLSDSDNIVTIVVGIAGRTTSAKSSGACS
ncbi:MAG: GspH/FimT family pseudopilin [Thauera sp.]|nr:MULTISPECIES: GspH/FimT family pseudopilin [Thauera]MDD3673947.1 GspH/FimT family pseudopilin [Thauera propionica]MDX9887305.1 GspH/FimT family pseudopilin [Thauera sp.]